MLERQARLVLALAKEIATESQHVFITTEHLLLSFMHYPDRDTRDLLEACGIDLDILVEQIEAFLGDSDQVPRNHAEEEPKPTNALQRSYSGRFFTPRRAASRPPTASICWSPCSPRATATPCSF